MTEPRWVNQYAYDCMWQGQIVRVYIKRQKPIVLTESLIRDCAVDFSTFVRKGLGFYPRLVKSEHNHDQDTLD